MTTPLVNLQSITGVDVELRIAGPGSRSYAFLIDWHIRVIAALAWIFAMMMLYGVGFSLLEMRASFASIWFVIFLPASIIYFLYHPILETLMRGRTPGKRMAGVRLVTRSGDIPGVGALLVRNVFRLIDSLPALYIVGLAVVTFTAQHVRIGDLAAGTLLVVDDREHEKSLDEATHLAGARGHDPKALELVQELLDRWKSLDGETRERLARSLILRIDSNAAPEALALERSNELRQRLEALLSAETA